MFTKFTMKLACAIKKSEIKKISKQLFVSVDLSPTVMKNVLVSCSFGEPKTYAQF